MTTTLKQISRNETANPGIHNAMPVVDALADVLNETYSLIIKSHTYHWNVTGPQFFAVHSVTEEQYTNMFAAADVIAERIRALGEMASVNLASQSKTLGEAPTADAMLEDLLSDHEKLVRSLHTLVDLAEDAKDPVTADLATERAGFHEKAAWILRSMAA
ncbi:Dps family protein [Pseudorhodobacter sp.]|uniref:Dps family protein n=1 Tax=Pseudorhodobacter sp. TaxID=1934400 RepID=UPI002647C09E|nr:DNA starvation/stationary phase protection protein [Pseudorhodobacter sp.]MDN5786594.1 DNA starvation/stationary phase protection protein [Pseudorhodobacter sp.]